MQACYFHPKLKGSQNYILRRSGNLHAGCLLNGDSDKKRHMEAFTDWSRIKSIFNLIWQGVWVRHPTIQVSSWACFPWVVRHTDKVLMRAWWQLLSEIGETKNKNKKKQPLFVYLPFFGRKPNIWIFRFCFLNSQTSWQTWRFHTCWRSAALLKLLSDVVSPLLNLCFGMAAD